MWRIVIILNLLAVWVGRNSLDAKAKQGYSSRKSLPNRGLKPVAHKICELCYKLHILYSLYSILIEVTVSCIRHYLL